jgi:hypothetical protein
MTEKTMVRAVQITLLLTVIVALLTSCASSRNGYGCKGKESWNKMVRRINNGY